MKISTFNRAVTVLIVILLVFITLVACGDKYKSYPAEGGSQTEEVMYKELVKDHLYYIPHKSDTSDFAPRYAAFIKTHPEFEIFDIEQDANEQMHNSVSGYYIFVKKVE